MHVHKTVQQPRRRLIAVVAAMTVLTGGAAGFGAFAFGTIAHLGSTPRTVALPTGEWCNTNNGAGVGGSATGEDGSSAAAGDTSSDSSDTGTITGQTTPGNSSSDLGLVCN
jgi:hypothetical protein